MNVTLQEMKIDIAQFIDKVLKASRAIDRETLCIVQSKLVWNLQIDLFVLNEDGNLVDACFLATVAALMNTRLPEVTLAGPSKIRINESKLRNLNVHHIPVCTSFFFVEGVQATKPIVDATSKEEKLAKSRLSICMNIFEDLCGMSTLGSLEIDPRIIIECTKIAMVLTKEITKKVRDAFALRTSLPLLDFGLSNQRKTHHLQSIAQANSLSAGAFLNSFFTTKTSQDDDIEGGIPEEEIVKQLREQAKTKKQGSAVKKQTTDHLSSSK